MAEEKELHLNESKITFYSGMMALLFDGQLNILLVALPFAILSYITDFSDAATFTLSLIALAPLAERLGFITEQLAIHTNETIGGLLNATFGNLTELLVSVTAMYRGMFQLVQLSLLGSILSNLLLVLGTAFFLGGMKYKVQNFSKLSSQINSILLLLSCVSVIFPTVLSMNNQESAFNEVLFSRIISACMVLLYIAFLYFQLISHKQFYDTPTPEPAITGSTPATPVSNKAKETDGLIPTVSPIKQTNNNSSAIESNGSKNAVSTNSNSKGGIKIPPLNISTQNNFKVMRTSSVPTTKNEIKNKEPEQLWYGSTFRTTGRKGFESLKSVENEYTQPADEENGNISSNESNGDDDDDEEEEDVLGLNYGLFWLAVVAFFIALLSESISGSIEKAAHTMGISSMFLSAIILPIVGNAAEHAGAIVFAMKNKLDLSIGVAIGSSTQIALFVLPLVVVLGAFCGKNISLNFGVFEACTMVMTVIIVSIAIKDGSSNWLVGLALLVVYLMIAIGFLVDTRSLDSYK
eukprot:gene7759-10544_t